MRPLAYALCAFAALALAGCASITEGTSQPIFVDVQPENATCKVRQKGVVVASVTAHQKTITVPKSKEALFIDCVADGFLNNTLQVESSASGMGVIGCVLIDLCITDYSTGALNKYPDAVQVALQRASGSQVAPTLQSSFTATPQLPQGAPVWRTVSDNAKAYAGERGTGGMILMPATVDLSLIRTDDQWGLFSYKAMAGAPADAWIRLTDVRRQ